MSAHLAERPDKRVRSSVARFYGRPLYLCALGVGLAFGIHAQPTASGSWLVSADGVACGTGTLRLDERATNLIDDAFTEGVRDWRTKNYESVLAFERQQENGVPFLSIRNPDKKRDTAFGLTSRTVAVLPGTRFDLRIVARGPAVFARARGCGEHYHMRIRWLGANGASVETRFFGLDCRPDAWRETRVTGDVPENAERAVIDIGADSPNILPDEPLDIRRVTFSTQTRGVYRSAGEAVSRPLPFPRQKAALKWKADCPASTRVAFQVATAPDADGAPGRWSPFAGPDNRPDRAFETSGEQLPPLPPTARWIRYRVRLRSDDASRTPAVRAVAVGDAEDTAWCGIDQTPPALTVLSPNLTAAAQAPIRFTLEDPTFLRMDSLRFWTDGQEETGRLRHQRGVFAFTPEAAFAPIGQPRDASDTPPNLHFFRVTVEDQAGNRLDKTWPLLIDRPSEMNRASLRGDGAVLIDGKPFFPIGIYAVWKKAFNSNSFDRAFDELKANGFNVAHTYNSGRTPEFHALMDAAARHGIRLFLASGCGANCTDPQKVLADVARERAHPAVLAWYLADDTASHVIPEQLADLSEMIHTIDPAHITVQADGVGAPPRSNCAEFVGATDGFLPELYPIRGDDDVPQIITDMQTLRADIRAAGNPVKTVWPIIQYFEGWGWPRFPTADELRAMSFLALIHGANGITWYTYGGHGNNHGATHTPETWRTMCGVAREISGLQNVLLAATVPAPQVTIDAGPQQDRQGHPSVSVLAKRFQDKRVLLCANSAKAEVRAVFALPDAKTVTDRQKPDRTLAFAQGALTDTFSPYGVRVYIVE